MVHLWFAYGSLVVRSDGIAGMNKVLSWLQIHPKTSFLYLL